MAIRFQFRYEVLAHRKQQPDNGRRRIVRARFIRRRAVAGNGQQFTELLEELALLVAVRGIQREQLFELIQHEQATAPAGFRSAGAVSEGKIAPQGVRGEHFRFELRQFSVFGFQRVQHRHHIGIRALLRFIRQADARDRQRDEPFAPRLQRDDTFAPRVAAPALHRANLPHQTGLNQ
ncbi:hypothetical protein P9286_29030 [Caballeronia sp. LZ031]|nr:hypothetical protein [Caballeronia sp. LZ031]MDR5845099.1 hypothetical protein [Caballeronia sp. LZ031]